VENIKIRETHNAIDLLLDFWDRYSVLRIPVLAQEFIDDYFDWMGSDVYRPTEFSYSVISDNLPKVAPSFKSISGDCT
jgi:hypothetical protein